MPAQFEPYQQQQQLQQEQSSRKHSELQLPARFYQQQQETQSAHQQPSQSLSNPPSSCQCIPGLSALLHDLKRTGNDRKTPASLDNVLTRVSEALCQWSALAACPRCQNQDGEDDDDDDGETLLLAEFSMRRVAAQLRAAGCVYGTNGFGGVEPEASGGHDDDCRPELRVGAYQITGSDRTILLGVLQTITVRKLDAAVTTMRTMLRTKQARRHGDSDTAMLHHIDSMFDGLTTLIKK